MSKIVFTIKRYLSPSIRQQYAHTTTSAAHLQILANSIFTKVRLAAAGNLKTPRAALAKLSLDEVKSVRWTAAKNPNTPWEAVARVIAAVRPIRYDRQVVGEERSLVGTKFEFNMYDYEYATEFEEVVTPIYSTTPVFSSDDLDRIAAAMNSHQADKGEILKNVEIYNQELFQVISKN